MAKRALHAEKTSAARKHDPRHRRQVVVRRVDECGDARGAPARRDARLRRRLPAPGVHHPRRRDRRRLPADPGDRRPGDGLRPAPELADPAARDRLDRLPVDHRRGLLPRRPPQPRRLPRRPGPRGADLDRRRRAARRGHHPGHRHGVRRGRAARPGPLHDRLPAAARVPAQDDRHRAALPARPDVRRAGAQERRRGRAARDLPPAGAPDLRRRAGRRLAVPQLDEALGDARSRPARRLPLRARPPRRGLRELRLPLLGPLRERHQGAGHAGPRRRRAEELQPAARAGARAGARAPRRARLPLRRADRERAGHRGLALFLPARRGGDLGQGRQGPLQADHREPAGRLHDGHAVPGRGAAREAPPPRGAARRARPRRARQAAPGGQGLPARPERLSPLRAPRGAVPRAPRAGEEERPLAREDAALPAGRRRRTRTAR